MSNFTKYTFLYSQVLDKEKIQDLFTKYWDWKKASKLIYEGLPFYSIAEDES